MKAFLVFVLVLLSGCAAVLVLVLLSGCATIQQQDALDSYTHCATADVATTAIGLSTHTMAEGNPLTRAVAIKALGPVAGTIFPLIGLSILGYYVLSLIDKPVITIGAAAVTCGVALSNARIVRMAR